MHISLRSFFFILLALILAACAAPAAPTPTLTPDPTATATHTVEPTATLTPRQASVMELKKEVNVRETTNAEWQVGSVGQQVMSGGGVRTGDEARTRLDITDGTIVRLGANTEFTLEALSPEPTGAMTKWALAAGKVWTFVSKALGGGTFEIETPSGSATVRGSFLSLEYAPATGQVVATCLEGLCRLTGTTGAFTDLTTGQQSEIAGVGKAPSPAHPMDASELAEWVREFPEASSIVATITPAPTATENPTDTPVPTETETAAPTATNTKALPTKEPTTLVPPTVVPPTQPALGEAPLYTGSWPERTEARKTGWFKLDNGLTGDFCSLPDGTIDEGHRVDGSLIRDLIAHVDRVEGDGTIWLRPAESGVSYKPGEYSLVIIDHPIGRMVYASYVGLEAGDCVYVTLVDYGQVQSPVSIWGVR